MTTVNFPDQQQVEEQAAAWIAIIDRGITNTEQYELEAWLDLSPVHGETLVKCASMWDLLDVLRPIAKLMPMETHIETPEPINVANESFWPTSSLVAASVLLLVGLVWLLGPALDTANEVVPVVHEELGSPNFDVQRLKTEIGEFSTFTLADGSVLDLNTATEINVRFTDSERRLELVRGEAYFKVTKDASKPFIVSVGDDKVTALGTAFSVNANGIGNAVMVVTEVIVTEGKVRLNSGSKQQAVDLTPGQKVVAVDDTLHVSDDSDADALLAWREGIVVFQGESLTEVIREIDRYTPLRFKLLDPELAAISVGGFFKTGDLNQLLTVLENNFGVAHRRAGDEILLFKSI